MECQELEDPEFGSVQVTGNMEGDSATYMCDPTYTLQGNASRTCEVNAQGDFQWSGEEPTCECKHAVIILYCKAVLHVMAQMKPWTPFKINVQRNVQ